MAVLRHNGLIVEAAPEHGAAILSFTANGRDVLRAGTAEAVAESPLAAACFPCAPWFGRLYDGLNFNGEHIEIGPTLPSLDSSQAIHGEAWVRPWAVTAHTDVYLDCLFSSDGRQPQRFPFAYEARQIVQITEGALRIDLFLRNIGRRAMPAGLGLHPYFPRTPETRIAFAAGGFWTPPGDEHAGASAIPPGVDFSRGSAPPAATLDHTYTAFSGDAEIIQPDMTVRLTSNAANLHVYAPAGEDYVCLEPVTHRPGAFGDDVLEPGAGMSLSLTIAPTEG